MKILIVTPHFYPENFRINDLATELDKKGHKISVITGTPDYPSGKYFEGYGVFKKCFEPWGEIKVYRVPVFPRGKGKRWQLFLNYLSYVISGSLLALIMKKDFDIIFVNETSPITIGIPAILIKKLKKIPIIFWVLDLWPESVSAAGNLKTDIIPRLLMPLVRWIYRSCDKILVSSRGFINSILEKGVEREKVSYLPQWAESVFTLNKKVTNDLNVNLPNGFKILFAGNIGEAQDFDSILNAAELLRNHLHIHWIIVGNGSRFDYVKKQINIRNIERTFHLLGSFPLEAMPFFYSSADALLLSLKKQYIFSLTVPGKLQSYLAFGRPILAMLDGEGASIVEDAKAGFTCNSGDYERLAQNVLVLANLEREVKEQFCENARRYYLENFEREKILAKIESLLVSFSRT